MRAVAILLLLAAGASATEVSAGQKVTPIEKVIQMLNDMLGKAKKEKEEEATRYAEYEQFCKENNREKTRAIKKGTEKVEKLSADIEDADADVAAMAKDIGQLDGDISTWEMESKEAAFAREKANAEFEKAHGELTESIDAVERAVETIKAGPATGFVQTSLLELSSKSRIPEHARRIIASFLQKPDTETQLMQDAMEMGGSPAGPAHFESQSGGVLSMVEGLGEKFEAQREEVEKEETTEKNAHEMLQADLSDQLDGASKQREKKAAFKAQRETEKADYSGELADTEATLAEDKKFLADLTAECQQKAVDFEQRQATRQGEIEAIGKAIEIMSSDEVSGGSQHLPGLVQTSATASLAQLRSSDRSPALGIAADFLRDRARRTNSRMLSLIAVKMEADPFKKVTKMIKDMIQKLMEEAEEEAEHKGFCDKEMSTNKATRDTKTDEVASLKAESDQLTADLAKLAEEIAALGAAIADNDAAMAKATAIRQAEKEKNTATIADATVAQAAVQKAITVLKEFYDKAATATALTQESTEGGSINYNKKALAFLAGGARMPGAPETFGDKPYTGMGNGGVMGMLEVIESDFARLLEETTAAESENSKEYEQFSADSAQDKSVKSTEMKDKSSEQSKKEAGLNSAKKDMKSSQEELDAALAYFEKLKPSCVDAGVSYEERVARRKEEIVSLQEALKILSGEDVA